MSSKRILIAEDDISIRTLEQRILEAAGYEVDCVDNGDAAIELLKTRRYCVVVADVMMPGMDGFDLTKAIRQMFDKRLPVLLVTAVPDALKTAHDNQAHPLSVLQKPFAPQALITAVNLLASQNTRNAPSPPKPELKEEKPGWLSKLRRTSRK